MPNGSPHGRVTMTITFFCSQPVFILAVAVLLCTVSQVTCQEEGEAESPAQVLQDLLARYGDNSTITVPQLRSLLALLSQSQSEKSDEKRDETETTTATPPAANSSKVQTILGLLSAYLLSKGSLQSAKLMTFI